MEQFERLMVEYCSPTLAGLKTGSLFNYISVHNDELETELEFWNKELSPLGVTIRVMRRNPNGALVYLYRPEKLKSDLSYKDTMVFLSSIGYECPDAEKCINKLITRIEKCSTFPHEIGLFLGYPLHDVIGFIQNEGKNCRHCGLWKVYCNECQAQKTFCMFKKCTKVYCECFQKGTPIKRLTVAVKNIQNMKGCVINE